MSGKKRKLDESDVPVTVEAKNSAPTLSPEETKDPSTTTASRSTSSFGAFSLDSRLLQAIAAKNWSTPFDVQSRAIPLALEGKDILACSGTGTGKTAAYILPVIQSILQRKNGNKKDKVTSSLILVPTRELAQQVHKEISTFSAFCSKEVRAVNLTQQVSQSVKRTLIMERPDIIVTTPKPAADSIQTSELSVDGLTHLIIDEADLVISYDYEDDMKIIAEAISQGVQKFLMSATLSTEVNTLKGLFCRDPVVLDVQEKAKDGAGMHQYVVKCAEDEKFLLAYVIFKLKLIKGKCIVFVSDTDRCYRLKLFLEQFAIPKICIMNSELPVNSRLHVVDEFNKNVYDIIIAADEHEILDIHEKKSRADTKEDDVQIQPPEVTSNGTEDMAAPKSAQANGHADLDNDEQPTKKRRSSKKSKMYGVARGIDFQNVACVLNFDLPVTSKSYTHRIGRTARAGQTGMALSFVVPADQYRKHKSTTVQTTQHDEEVLGKITRYQQSKGREIKPYLFNEKVLENFRYRVSDPLRAVTQNVVREARTRELKQELLKSEKLKRHFEENPEDLQQLRHDGVLRPARIQQHLRHVPDYLMPSDGNKSIAGHDLGFVGLRKTTDNRIRKARMQKRLKGKGGKTTTKRSDPLQTFNAKGRR